MALKRQRVRFPPAPPFQSPACPAEARYGPESYLSLFHLGYALSPLVLHNPINCVGINVGKLSAIQTKRINRPGRHGDGDGLYLNLSTTGAKSWVQRVVADGRRRNIGLGRFPAVSLTQARSPAVANRTDISQGKDPLLEKRRPNIPTFKEEALRVHQANILRWRNGKHTVSWLQTLERHAFSRIVSIPVDRIGLEDVLSVLTPILGTRQETARRVRQRIRTVLKWCMAHGFVEVNVAAEAIDGALPSMPKLKAHLRSLPYEKVPVILTILEQLKASIAAKL